MRLFYTPRWLHLLKPQYTWRVPDAPKTLFLTFDDGPIPEVTPFVLDTLTQFGAKATFFCVGDNIRKYPEVFRQVQEAGHSVGNHTFNHLNGWKTDDKTYLANVASCAAYLPESRLFRPPYGKMRRTQAKKLASKYQIVLWDVLTYDFDATLAPETCLQKTQRYTRDGSIIVFHDSLKAENNLRYVLPRYLEWANAQGYQWGTL